MKPDAIKIIRLWEWRIFLLLIYALPLSEGLKNVCWGILLFLWLTRTISEKKWPRLEMVGITTLIWLLTGIWSSYFSTEPFLSWKGFWDMFRGSVLLWIGSSLLKDNQNQKAFFFHLILSTVLASLVGWIHYYQVTHDPLKVAFHHHLELPSIGHFNQSGIYLAMIWLVLLSSSLLKPLFLSKWANVSVAALIGLALLATTARSSIAVAGFLTLIMICIIKPPRWLLYVLTFGVAVILISLATSSSLRNRAFFQGSFKNRSDLWERAWQSTKDHPWTGVGLNNFKSTQKNDPVVLDPASHAHNLYVNALAQMGLPGFLALIGMLLATGRTIWKQKDKLIFYSAGGCWFVVVVVGLSNTTFHHEMSMLFFLMMGLALTNQCIYDEKNKRLESNN